MKTHLMLNLELYILCLLPSILAIGKSGTNHAVLILVSFSLSFLFTQFYLGNKILIKEFYGTNEY